MRSLSLVPFLLATIMAINAQEAQAGKVTTGGAGFSPPPANEADVSFGAPSETAGKHPGAVGDVLPSDQHNSHEKMANILGRSPVLGGSLETTAPIPSADAPSPEFLEAKVQNQEFAKPLPKELLPPACFESYSSGRAYRCGDLVSALRPPFAAEDPSGTAFDPEDAPGPVVRSRERAAFRGSGGAAAIHRDDDGEGQQQQRFNYRCVAKEDSPCSDPALAPNLVLPGSSIDAAWEMVGSVACSSNEDHIVQIDQSHGAVVKDKERRLGVQDKPNLSASDGAESYFSKLTADEKEGYTDWLKVRSSAYARSSFAPSSGDPDDGAAVFWSVRLDKGAIDFAVAVRADGWVGFGVSGAGGMIGSDVVLLTAAEPSLLVDAHVIEDRVHPLTDNRQDWELRGPATAESGWMIVEMSRLLDTGDPQDITINNDSNLWDPLTRIIAAWGDSDVASYHGGKKARKSMRLFADHSNEKTEAQVLLEILEEGSDGYFDMTENDYEIPAVDTTYHGICKTFGEDLNLIGLAEDEDTTLFMTGAIPIITQATAQFVHHFVTYLYDGCNNLDAQQGMLLYSWGPGMEGTAFPEDVAFPLFGDTMKKSIYIEFHYDNPEMKAGQFDSSGLRYYFTTKEREHRMGIVALGDPFSLLTGEEIGEGYTEYEFTCPGSCSALFIGQTENDGERGQPVTVLSEYLHMHQSGVYMTHEVLRGGKIHHKAVAEVFDFDQQGSYHVPQGSYQILPGDSFRTRCYYKDGTRFGLSSQEEMCIAFIMYYPVKNIQNTPWMCFYGNIFSHGCDQELEYSNIGSVGELGRNFGCSSGECGGSSLGIGPPTKVEDNLSNTTTTSADVAVLRLKFGLAADNAGFFQLLNQLNQRNITILVPSDEAIERDLGRSDMSRLLSPIWLPHLRDLLLYHMIQGTIIDLSEQLEKSETASTTKPTLQGRNVTVHRIDLEYASSFEKRTQVASMEITMSLYFTDRVYFPTSMTQSLREMLLQDKDQFSTFYEIIQLVNLEVPLSNIAPITLFVPTNAAWDALDPALISSLKLPAYRAELLKILSRHVVWEENQMSSDWTVGSTIYTLAEGEALEVTGVNPAVVNGTSVITIPDMLANNGIMHVLDKVILPDGFELKPRVASGRISEQSIERIPNANLRLNIVALGDSFIAGNGARGPNGERDYTNVICYRSDSSWPGLYSSCVAKEYAGSMNVQFANHACSGSLISDVYQTQLAGITSKTDLVFLTIGGNDLGTFDAVPSCYNHRVLSDCKERIEWSKELMKGDLKGSISQLLLDIRSAAHSQTKIVLTGVPYFGNDVAFEIANYPVGREIYAAGDMMDSVLTEAAAEANKIAGWDFVVFEDVKTLFQGKEFSAMPESVDSNSWMTSLDPSGTFGFKGEIYHYNAQGHRSLADYLCTRSDYNASQPADGPADGYSESALLMALLSMFACSLIILATLVYLKSSRTNHEGDVSQRWSAAIHRLHLPLKKIMATITVQATTRPKVCVAIGVAVSLGLFALGLATNFNIVTEQEVMWTPYGSRSESEGAWVQSMMTQWSNISSSLGPDSQDTVVTMIVHKKGANMVTTNGAEKMFDALDAVRKTPGYRDFCATHGVESACPSGYEYLCKMYSIPTESTNATDCHIGGATGFWFHNRSLYEEQVSSDADMSEAMSLDVFFGNNQNFNLRDVLGHPVYDGNDLLVSSTAFLSYVLFPKETKGVEKLRLAVVQELVKMQREWRDDEKNEYELEFLTTRSFPDEILRSAENDLVLLPVAFLIMSAFTFVAFTSKHPVNSRGALGLAALFTVLLSILSGYGILSIIGVPITSITQILQFVILGIGLDDSFLIKNAYERSDRSKDTVDRIKDTLDEVGVSIAMTSITSSVAFSLGCFSSIPAVRWLCVYGFTIIMVDFIYQITIFMALLVIDDKRIQASRKDIICCFKAPSFNSTDPEALAQAPANPGVMSRYAELLSRPFTKVLIVVLFSGLFVICSVATTRLDIGYDLASLLPADSYVINFENDLHEYTQRRVSTDVYFQGIDQGDILVQEQMKKYVNELIDGVDAIVAPPDNFWVTDYQDYLHEQGEALDELPFEVTLQRFLDDQRFNYKDSIIRDASGGIIASRTKMSFDKSFDINDGTQTLALMKSQAKVTREQPINAGRDEVSSFFSFNWSYFFWDFLVETEKELKATTIIGVTSMCAMALIFLPHWSGIFFVLPVIISLYVDMMGVLHLAGIQINGVSFVSVVMSLGLYVDYVLHVLLCYYESDGTTREEKVTRMLSTVGASVLLGGMSTLFGALTLAFNSSEVAYTIFVSFMATVVLGLAHGLILLPVVLSLIGPTNAIAKNTAEHNNSLVENTAGHDNALVDDQSGTSDEEVVLATGEDVDEWHENEK